MRYMINNVMRLEQYITYLQTLLQQNDIPYEERKTNPSKSESIDFDSLDLFAVRGPNENYDAGDDYANVLKGMINQDEVK